MENASKALLIAGSILIVILLIAMGVRVFTSTQGTTDSVETTMSATEMATFNSKFTQYVGTQKSKAQVMSLLNTIIANNATSNHQVKVVLSGTTTSAQNAMNSLAKEKYTISIGESNYSAGYVISIKID